MSAHTPGPWEVEKRTQRGEFVRTTHIVTPDGAHLADVGPCNIDANAHLIASAPDMLAALKATQANLYALLVANKETEKKAPKAWAAINAAYEAINKAEGRA